MATKKAVKRPKAKKLTRAKRMNTVRPLASENPTESISLNFGKVQF